MHRDQDTLLDLFSSRVLTDGGMETSLVFHHGLDLPEFAAFAVLGHEDGRRAMRAWYDEHLDLASRHGMPFVLETPTWRASRDWGAKLGLDAEALAEVNRASVRFVRERRDVWASRVPRTVISGCLGPRGDGYVVGDTMTPAEAADYHAEQIGVLAEAGVDLVTSFTIPYGDEGHGISRAAERVGVPSVIGFTVETDGSLPSGESLADVIPRIDAECAPLHYMINCAHPEHFADLFDGAPWTDRIRAIRANASCRSHAELEAMDTLDDGEPHDLGRWAARLFERLPRLSVIGGCCGTDARHIAAMARAAVG